MSNYIVVDPGLGKTGSYTDVGIYLGKINAMFKLRDFALANESLEEFIATLQKVLGFKLILNTEGPGYGLMPGLKKKKIKFVGFKKWNSVIDHDPSIGELLERVNS